MEESLESFLSVRPHLSELTEQVITNKWYLLGVQLKCDIKKLDELYEKNSDNAYKTLKMFQLWLDSTPTASRRDVLDALRKRVVSENGVAEEYERYLKEFHESTCKNPL